MRFNQVLVAFKQVPPAGSKPILEGHQLHLKTLDKLYLILRKEGIPFESCSTAQLKSAGGADIIITVGGDGTVLTASHFAGKQPVLGIKSYGQESVGYFCATNTEEMAGYLRNLFSGGVKPIKLHRLEISIGGHKVEELALNDMLFAHASPAATTRYILRVSGKSEAQRSSGVWVSSAAGSTAAAASAGGKPLPLESKKMEYVVREPYDPSKSFRLLKGVLASGSEVRIESASKHGTVYIDGAGIQYPAPEGTNISARVSERPLNIFWRS